ncbi:MAG: hypothetical protein VR78_17015 [Hoeflea sp. BRH_c9]|nr:MAG: hypothetical protein VR78_17015 [Hoeflea sp. BRH_c9]
MARKYTLFVYNTSNQDQEWNIYCDGVINQTFTIGNVRKTFTLMLSGDAVIQFGVDDTVYLKAAYDYGKDSWASKTDTPNDISFATGPGAITVSSDFTPDQDA